jgi:hypothetical protein
MLGYNPPEKPRGNKKLRLLIQNLENIVELLKEEIGETEEDNFIEVSKLLQTMQEPEPDYYEDDE